ncbi:pantetheine-phosphate adenylyltransferase [Roseateles sp. BYS96W]|jgi:pantetheine-phosphate adenylyltransferase|uniref:Phosphopantetheine adenylyltransferase n=1 Tax=Pelomonas nitida TaxID=3299027 RepID=A0ABW7GA90_9BURK
MTSRKTISAVYPGTFDPITLGHEDLMRRAAGMFERLVLAVAVGHHKKTLFSLDERLAMAREVAAQCCPQGNVEVFAFDGLLRDFVRSHEGRVVVRGLRTGGDFEYEFQMAGMNRKLMPEVETIFLTPGEQHQYTSSTFVREIATLGGEVAEFVSPGVLARLDAKFKGA